MQQDVHALLQLILERAKRLLQVSGAGVIICDPVKGDLELAAASGIDVPIGTRIAMGEGVTGKAAQMRRPLCINDYHQSLQRSERFDYLRIQSVLAVPLLSGGELIGVLSVASFNDRRFTEADEHLLSLFAAQAAVAMRNALLLEETRRRTEQLARSEARTRRLVDSNIIGIVFWEMDGAVTSANDAFLQMVGYAREELAEGKLKWIELTPAEYHAGDAQALAELRECGRCTPYEKEFFCKDGRRLPVLVGGALMEGSQQQGVAFVLDLTERRRAEGRVRYLAQHDVLTGLPNRMVFQDRLDLSLTRARRDKQQVAVLFIDLDHFKHVNDSLGHQIGDALLKEVAKRLQSCLREGDNVARLGGDEFIVSLASPHADKDAALVAYKVLEAVAQSATVNSHELYVTASIGIGLYPADGADTDTLLRAADSAMYHAKEKGKNNYQFFTTELNEAATRRLTIANQLHRALDRAEFVLHYQPQVDMESGRILEAEVLLRWPQPDDSLMPPQEFVKIAEETGLIVPLGEWVLLQACTHLKQWLATGHTGLRMAVNISPRQLRRPDFPRILQRILDSTGVSASDIVLEITEGVLMMQSMENLNMLSRLTGMGCRLAVDDFGVGYSSLAYLQRFPIHKLKIDQSFVSEIGHDRDDNALVLAIIAMAHGLRLEIVAEGVETREQAAFLQRHGCLVAQGYYYSQPVPEQEFGRMLQYMDGRLTPGHA